MAKNPPDALLLQEIYATYRNRYVNLREKQDEWAEIYEQRQDLRLKGALFAHPTYTPDAMLIVDRIAETYAMDEVIVHQDPRPSGRAGGETQKARDLADKNEKWLKALLDENRENDPYYLRELYKLIPYRGQAYVGWDVNFQTLSDPEKYPGMPLEIVVPDPRTVMSSLEAERGEPDWFFWDKTVTVQHLKAKAAEWNEGKAVKLALGEARETDLVYLCEWWTKDWMGYCVVDCPLTITGNVTVFDVIPFNGEIAVPNPLGFSPWLRTYSGLGTTAFDGNPVRPARGLLAGIEDILTQKSRSYTKRDAHTSRYVLPRTIAKVGTPGYRPHRSDGTMELGSLWVEDDTRVKEWREIQPPPIPEGLMQETAEQDRALENYRPGVLRGVPIPGEPASSQSSRLGLATLKDSPMESAVKQTVARLCQKALRIVDVMGASVEIAGHRLSAEDINGYYRASIVTKPGNPEALRYDYMLAMQLWDKIPNKRWIVENFLHVEDATQFLLDIDVEEAKRQLLADPAYRQMLYSRVFQRLGMQEEIAALQKQGPAYNLPGRFTQLSPSAAPGQGAPVNPQPVAGSAQLGVPAAAGTAASPGETTEMARARAVQEMMNAQPH